MMLRKKTEGKKRNRRLKEPLLVRASRLIARAARILALAALAPSLAYGGWWFYGELATTEHLAIRQINVAGCERVESDEVVELSGLRQGQNLISFDADEVLEAVKSNPWVAGASLKRRIPDTVDIFVTERVPMAFVKMDGLYVMDSSGVVFKRFALEDGLDLPVITGLFDDGMKEDSRGLEAGVFELIGALRSRGGFNIDSVAEIHVDPSFGLTIYTLYEGVRIDLGTGKFEEKMASLDRIIMARNNTLRGIEAVDLDNSSEVVVRFTNKVVREGGDANGQKG